MRFILLTIALTNFAISAEPFNVAVESNLYDFHIHKLIVERELLSQGVECGPNVMIGVTREWSCNKKKESLLCYARFECMEGKSDSSKIEETISKIDERIKYKIDRALDYYDITKLYVVRKTDDYKVDITFKYVADPNVKKTKSTELAPVGSESELENRDPNRLGMNFAMASASFIYVTDKNSGSLRTFDITWSPSYRITATYALFLNFGTHMMTSDDENFFAVDGYISPAYYMKKFYVKANVGMQKWTDDKAEIYPYFGGSLHYRFTGDIDSIFVQYAKITNDASNNELKLGMALTF